MSNGKKQEPDTTALRQSLKEAKQKMGDAATPAERFGAQRRLNAVLRAMQSAGMDTSEVRVIAPKRQAPPVRPAPVLQASPAARAPTAQEAMAERRRTEKELGIERGGAKKDTVPERIKRKGG